jgi:hypothetical protein
MRILMKIEMATEAANAAMTNGTLGKTVQAILDEQKPEAAYFIEFGGKRTAIVVVELSEASQIPALAEPWFLAFNANVELHPAMLPEDLMDAEPHIERAVKRYG